MFTSPQAKKQKLRTQRTPHFPLTVRTNSSESPRESSREVATNSAIERIRELILNCILQNEPEQAKFFSDKLICMSSDRGDQLLLARACFASKDYYRAIHVLNQFVDSRSNISENRRLKLMENTIDMQYKLSACVLLVKSLLAVKQLDHCQEILNQVLDENETMILEKAQSQFELTQHQNEISIFSTLCLLRGEVYEALDNRLQAIHWYKLALQCDARCAEAFNRLLEKQMLTVSQENELLQLIKFTSPDDKYLELIYTAQLNRYSTDSTVESKFQELDTLYQFHDNISLMLVKAEAYFNQQDIEKAYKLCKQIRDLAPYDSKLIPIYVTSLVELQKKDELFHFAHQMVAKYPSYASSWYTVASYYYLVKKYEQAHRYFNKSTIIESTYAPAWIGFGNVFAIQEESDQAISAYSTASRLTLGSHLPYLAIGMEHLRTNNLASSLQFIQQACAFCPVDPLVYNELGAVYFNQHNFKQAEVAFQKAIALCQRMAHVKIEYIIMRRSYFWRHQ